MAPKSGESAEEMFRTTRWQPAALNDSSTIAVFYHDVPPELARQLLDGYVATESGQ